MPDVLIPTSGDELEATLNDPKKLKEIAANPANLGTFIKNYVTDQRARDAAAGDVLKQQVQEQAQIVLAELLKEGKVTLTNRGQLDLRRGGQPERGAAYNPEARGVALDGEFKNLGEYLYSLAPRNTAGKDKWAKIRNDYSSVDPALGGFLVPEILRSTLLQNSLENSVVRSRATVITMDGPSVPFPAIDETTHVGSVYGGITGTWVAEGEALPESEARFGRVVLKANKLVTYCEVPNELPQDAPQAFSGFITSTMPKAIGFFEDIAFMNGNGVGRPLGALNAANTALLQVAIEGTQGADTIVWQNIIKMFARMLPSSLSTGVWLAAIDTFPELATMALTVGTGGSAVWLNNGVEGPPMTILGRPVYFTEKTAKLGDLGDISFVDWSQYLVGDRAEMRVQASEHYKFGNDVVAYRVIERADGRPWMKSALTPANGGPTLSPYVTLAAR
jgi:HK97 family phage major capsid protein